MPSQFPQPAWPEEVVLQDDLSPSQWILARLLPSFLTEGEGMPVGALVPTGYQAYVRVLHPVDTGGREPPVTWRDVAAATGRTYHPLMQFHQITQPDAEALGLPPLREPWTGRLTLSQCHVLYSLLSHWTTTPTVCWLGIWEGKGVLYGSSSRAVAVFQPKSRDEREQKENERETRRLNEGLEDTARLVRQAPHFAHPARKYLLAKTGCASVCTLQRFPLGITPNLAWPDDQAWFVASEIDFDSTLVGASEECAAALLADEVLETVPIRAEDRLDVGGDLLNPPVDR